MICPSRRLQQQPRWQPLVPQRQKMFLCCCDPCVCGTEVLNDDFSVDSLGDYTEHSCPDGSGDTPDFSISGGLLRATDSSSSGTLYQTFARPALNGLCLSISADIGSGAGAATTAVLIGGARWFGARWGFGNYGRRACDSVGCPTGGLTGFTGTPGGRITLRVIDSSSGGGTYTVQYCRDGVVLATETSVSLTIPDPFLAGVRNTGGATWDNLVVATN